MLDKSNNFKKVTLSLFSAAALLCASAVNAAIVKSIDFSEVGVFTPDPVISGTTFNAGNSALFEDTFTDDALTPGNPYLVSGADSFDILGTGTLTSLIEISTTALGGSGFDTTISLDAGLNAPLPGFTDLFMDVYLSGVLKGSDSINTNDSSLHGLSLTLTDMAFDNIFLYDTGGNFFRIDNYSVDVSSNTVGPGPSPMPEPSTIFLFGAALAGMGFTRRSWRKRQ